MIRKFSKLKLLDWLIIIFFVLLCFQQISIISLGGFKVKLYHIFSFIFLPVIIKYKFKFPPLFVNLFFCFILISSICSSVFYGFSSLLFNYIFCYYVIFIFINVFKLYSLEKITDILKIGAWFVLLMLVINMVTQYKAILAFMYNSWGGHPIINSIFGGGVNLDATWIVVIGGIFIKSKKREFYLYWTICFIISLLLSSRTGLIGDVLLLFLYIYYNNRFVKFSFYSLLAIIFVLIVLITTSYGKEILNRFLSTGDSDELGSLGRLNMWKWVLNAFKNNPLGYGTGNNIKAIELVSGLSFTDGNLHNLYLQFLVDNGLFGFIIIVYLFFAFLFKNIRKEGIFCCPIILYLLMGFLQFRGGDAIMALMFAVYINEQSKLGYKYKRNYCYSKKSKSLRVSCC